MMGDRQQKQQQRRRTQRQVQQRRQPLNLAGSTKGASPGAEEHIESTRSKRVDRGSCERGAVVHVRPCSASSAPSASGATRAAGRDPSEDAAHCAHGAADGAAPSPPSAGPTPTAWVFMCVVGTAAYHTPAVSSLTVAKSLVSLFMVCLHASTRQSAPVSILSAVRSCFVKFS